MSAIKNPRRDYAVYLLMQAEFMQRAESVRITEMYFETSPHKILPHLILRYN